DRSPASAYRRDARGAAVLRARDRGPRGTSPWRRRARSRAHGGDRVSSTAPVAVQPAPAPALGQLVCRRLRAWVRAVVVLVLAFAPIANAWFSPFSKSSKIVIAAVLCFFPVLVNALRGLTSVRTESLELMHSYAAGQVAIFRRVRIPNALPFIFAGLKVSSVL